LGKPGSGVRIINIIDDKQSKYGRLLDFTLTLSGWVFLGFSLFQILLSLILWYFHIARFDQLLIVHDPNATFKIIALTAAFCGFNIIVLNGWRMYNRKKYGDLNRRSFPIHVSEQEIGNYFNISPELVTKLQRNKWTDLEDDII
jgi:poly-beta-1,6-N-acetyl-D-glucosamine biosynthesis protein PgaD